MRKIHPAPCFGCRKACAESLGGNQFSQRPTELMAKRAENILVLKLPFRTTLHYRELGPKVIHEWL